MVSTAVDGPPAATTTDAASADRPSGLLTSKGVTTIAPVVVEKIAGQAATEIDGVAVTGPAGLRRFFSSGPPEGPAEADARVGSERTAVAVTVSVRYPMPVATTSERIRSTVARRVHELTGLLVSSVDVTVAQLPSSDPVRPRRVE